MFKKLSIIAFSMMAVLSSCMKDSYDSPDPIKDPNLTANWTINELKTQYAGSGKVVMPITEDKIIVGIVTADDKSGNFYKEIVIQEEGSNGGSIGLKIDRSNLYNDLPIGRRVFIKLKGMAVSNYNSLIQIGGYVDTVTVPGAESLGSIPSSQIGVTVLKGSLGHKINAQEMSIGAMSSSDIMLQYRLIKIIDAEFNCTSITSTYADAVNQNDADRTITTPDGKSIVVRNSGFSNFAATKVNPNKGELTAIYTIYRTTKQLKIRDLTDINFVNTTRSTPCSGGGGGGGGGGTAVLKTIAEIRAMYAGNGVKLTDYYFEGIVISDRANGNINSQNMVVQDASGGIVVRFSSAHSYNLGDKVKITLTGDSLTKFNSLMQVFIPGSGASANGTGTATVKTVTLSDIINNFSTYESTLVKIAAATFTGTGTYSGSKTMTDGTGSITHYTASASSFATTALPTTSKDVTGIIGVFGSTKQISIRNLSDVQ